MNLRPLHDRIVIKRLDAETTSSGGIVLPDTATEKPQRGQVIATGQGKLADDGNRIPLDVKAGDQVLFGKYSGTEVKLEGEDFIVMREDDIMAVIE